jgi:hypothetical protein
MNGMYTVADYQRKADFHREMAESWQKKHDKHVRAENRGRMNNARIMYMYHMRELARVMVHLTGQPVQMAIVP